MPKSVCKRENLKLCDFKQIRFQQSGKIIDNKVPQGVKWSKTESSSSTEYE